MKSDDMNAHVSRPHDHLVEPMPWGRLEWSVAARLGNSETMTIGTCFIDPGNQNGRHYHPNCDEVLRVVRGRIIQSWDGVEVEMGAGDVISIPSGVVHHARNVGVEVAELAIAFSSAHRETIDAPDPQ